MTRAWETPRLGPGARAVGRWKKARRWCSSVAVRTARRASHGRWSTFYERVETLGFKYGQRHLVELQQRPALIAAMQTSCTELLLGRTIQDTVLNVPTITEIGDTAMTSDVEITMGANGLPTTFVPARHKLVLPN